MKRRSFMQMLGVAPVAAVVSPALAEPVSLSALEESWMGGDWYSWDNEPPAPGDFTEIVRATIKANHKELETNLTQNNALFSYLKSKGKITA